METKLNIPITFNQIFQLVRKLSVMEKQKLLSLLIKDNFIKTADDKVMTHFASEKALAKDWLSSEEDQAWKDL
jgi:hypothetical protein